MDKKELIIKLLKEMGLLPKVDDDGDIVFRYQMKDVFVTTNDEDDKYVTVALAHFYNIREEDVPIALTVCNKLTREMKIMKVFADNTLEYVSASCEFFYTNEDSLEYNLNYSLRILGFVYSLFKKNMKELSNGL